ncbi:MAG: AraC family transcriptional regulator [Planctomycetes bacterium]|nr:AraC family transcriptional regulator [Planctomycetota bacterium]
MPAQANLREYSALTRPPDKFPRFSPGPNVPDERLDQWLEAVRITPLSSHEWQCSERWELGPRIVNDSMWHWIESGSGWGRVGAEGKRFRIKAGDLVLMPQGAEHNIRQDKGVAMHLFAVHFHAHVYGSINLLDLLGFPGHLPGGPKTPYADACKRLAREFAVKAPGWRRSMGNTILQVLLYMIREEGERFRAPHAKAAHAELPRLLPALEFIDRNLDDRHLKVLDLAKQLFVSEVQFRKLFRRVTGMSPVRFLQRRRIERACSLLRGSDLGIEQIAEQCGFADASFFCRVFKHWTKMTPGHYRTAEGL